MPTQTISAPPPGRRRASNVTNDNYLKSRLTQHGGGNGCNVRVAVTPPALTTPGSVLMLRWLGRHRGRALRSYFYLPLIAAKG